MYKFILVFLACINLVYAGSGTKLIGASYLSYDKNIIKLISDGKVYRIDNKIALQPLESVCNKTIYIPSSSIQKVSRASKRQLSLKCSSNPKKVKSSR